MIKDGEIKDDSGAQQHSLVMGTALVGAVDDMEFFGQEEIEHLNGQQSENSDKVIHFEMQKYDFFFVTRVFFVYLQIVLTDAGAR